VSGWRCRGVDGNAARPASALLSLSVAAPRLRGRAVCGAGGTRGGAVGGGLALARSACRAPAYGHGGRACAFLLLPFRPVLSSPLLSSHAARGRSRARPRRGGRACDARFRRAEGAFPPRVFPHARAVLCQGPRRKGEEEHSSRAPSPVPTPHWCGVVWCGAGVRPCCCWIPLSSPMEIQGSRSFSRVGQIPSVARLPRTTYCVTTPHHTTLMLVCSRSQP
jgi:hypothetical protein